MKKVFIHLVLALFLVQISCEKNDDVGDQRFQFDATVIGKGLDCGETYLIDLKNSEGNSEIADGTYYADGLPAELKVDGLKIILNGRIPDEDELYPCTTLGVGYPHIIVQESAKSDSDEKNSQTASCENFDSPCQLMDLEKFTLRLPMDWKRFYPEYTDGFFGGITNHRDTLYFDYGVFSFGSIDDIKENGETLSFENENLKVGGQDAKIVKEKRQGEIKNRFSLYVDRRDEENLNRLFGYDIKEEELARKIFLTHRFK